MGAGMQAPAEILRALPGSEPPLPSRDGEKIEQLGGRPRHERSDENGDLPDHLGCHIENRPLPEPDRSWRAPRVPGRRRTGWRRR